jgi:hypothetical protein
VLEKESVSSLDVFREAVVLLLSLLKVPKIHTFRKIYLPSPSGKKEGTALLCTVDGAILDPVDRAVLDPVDRTTLIPAD